MVEGDMTYNHLCIRFQIKNREDVNLIKMKTFLILLLVSAMAMTGCSPAKPNAAGNGQSPLRYGAGPCQI
jgi:hypothetical protein